MKVCILKLILSIFVGNTRLIHNPDKYIGLAGIFVGIGEIIGKQIKPHSLYSVYKTILKKYLMYSILYIKVALFLEYSVKRLLDMAEIPLSS